MTLQVVGAGVGRTGTKSLQEALSLLLGGRCYHMVEVFGRLDEDVPVLQRAAEGQPVDWHAFFDGWVATVDFPTCVFWRELADAFPDALVLLSTRRDFATWYRSASDTIFRGMDHIADADERSGWDEMMHTLLGRHFTLAMTDEAACREAYERHNAEVRAGVPAERLLEWQPGDGWEPICERLGLAVPDQPFPHSNTTADFQAHFE